MVNLIKDQNKMNVPVEICVQAQLIAIQFQQHFSLCLLGHILPGFGLDPVAMPLLLRTNKKLQTKAENC